MKLFEGERIWRLLTDFWSFIVLAFVVVNFVTQNRYEYLVVPLCVLYTGILALYVGTKEFDRWYDHHRTRHPGEWFVILWTVVMAVMIVAAIILGPPYVVNSDIVAVYIAVLSIYVVTQKSKTLHRDRVREEHAGEGK
jgi:lysylphosphatidylglycerol synthetase-like protein (DUF2156 family)